ncbi:MAG: polysaccharide deacetylase family protein [Ruminococcus sp.]|nr:polysaccharide deacetylase family protein [Ruminococcus sp.]
MWNGKNKTLTFSYDDGITQDKRLVEIFNKYGLKCTFNLNSGIMNENGSFNIGNLNIKRMTQEELPELYSGHEIAVHTLTHPNLLELDDNDVRREILGDKDNLERIFGKKIYGMAYPYGTFDERIIRIARECGIKFSRTTMDAADFKLPDNLMELKATCHHKNPKLLGIFDDFLNYDGAEPAVFCLWGHSYEFDLDDSWERIEEFCRRAANRSDIFYGTNSEVYLNV